MSNKTSIVIAVWNALAYFKKAVESIRQHTTDYELIIVDNGSRADCVEYIKSLECVKIFNATNLGPGEAFNQGIKASSGNYICLLNSDAEVTAGWLPPMLRTLDCDKDIGVVGPLCNNISSVQTCMALKHYPNICLMKGYVMPFVCVVMRREIFTRAGVGLIARRFRAGCSEDSEFCNRLDRAKYLKCVVANSFVHHALSQSYKDNNVSTTVVCKEMGALIDVPEEIEFLEK